MTAEKLSTLDYVFAVLSKPSAPLDFAFVLHFSYSLCVEALNAGARSARNKYPTTNSTIRGNRWVTLDSPNNMIDVDSGPCPQTTIENFVNRPFSLKHDRPYRQLLIKGDRAELVLVSQFHHAAADGLSAALWLTHQLQVASDHERPLSFPSFYSMPQLRYLSPSVRRSKFAYSEPSDCLRTVNQRASGKRKWLTFDFDAEPLRHACRIHRGFTYNDLLATITLEVLRAFNQTSTAARIGLWVPVNIRREFRNGFGNGTSRIRLYARYERDATIMDKAREIRRQVSWCTENGEWVVPNIPWLRELPQWTTRPFLQTFLNRRSVDMATAVFSHSDSWAGGAGAGLQYVQRIECVGLMHPRQAIAINGMTHHGKTSLTLTYDSGLVSATEAQRLRRLYEEQLALAQDELLSANR
jgi:hypothetical protein